MGRRGGGSEDRRGWGHGGGLREGKGRVGRRLLARARRVVAITVDTS